MLTGLADTSAALHVALGDALGLVLVVDAAISKGHPSALDHCFVPQEPFLVVRHGPITGPNLPVWLDGMLRPW